MTIRLTGLLIVMSCLCIIAKAEQEDLSCVEHVFYFCGDIGDWNYSQVVKKNDVLTKGALFDPEHYPVCLDTPFLINVAKAHLKKSDIDTESWKIAAVRVEAYPHELSKWYTILTFAHGTNHILRPSGSFNVVVWVDGDCPALRRREGTTEVQPTAVVVTTNKGVLTTTVTVGAESGGAKGIQSAEDGRDERVTPKAPIKIGGE